MYRKRYIATLGARDIVQEMYRKRYIARDVSQEIYRKRYIATLGARDISQHLCRGARDISQHLCFLQYVLVYIATLLGVCCNTFGCMLQHFWVYIATLLGVHCNTFGCTLQHFWVYIETLLGASRPLYCKASCYHTFHSKIFIPEIHQMEMLRFLGISRCKFKSKTKVRIEAGGSA